MSEMNNDAKLKVTNLTKKYGDNLVLKGIDLTVKTNEVVVVIGPSGSGKVLFKNSKQT
ncbi:hypothetical protein NBRC111893_2046 [Lentilactobacillus kosonis]|uniref:Uncharacterized protein n=1 Tax=Lentilactobacillus kosonis TaxID=2810561 RepID=A0A401FNE2_9LACO|nr:hypothetical protein NBRC111893_2046 [Lentilactobacillus kosonis]